MVRLNLEMEALEDLLQADSRRTLGVLVCESRRPRNRARRTSFLVDGSGNGGVDRRRGRFKVDDAYNSFALENFPDFIGIPLRARRASCTRWGSGECVPEGRSKFAQQRL